MIHLGLSHMENKAQQLGNWLYEIKAMKLNGKVKVGHHITPGDPRYTRASATRGNLPKSEVETNRPHSFEEPSHETTSFC